MLAVKAGMVQRVVTFLFASLFGMPLAMRAGQFIDTTAPR
jgi:hypothetical protein